MSSPAPQPGAPPNLPPPPPQHPLARPLRTSTAPHTMLSVCPGVAPGYDGAATLHAATSELGRVLWVPRRFVHQRLERPPHLRQQLGSVPPATSTSCVQSIHLNTLASPRAAVSMHRAARTCVAAANFPPTRKPPCASPPAGAWRGAGHAHRPFNCRLNFHTRHLTTTFA